MVALHLLDLKRFTTLGALAVLFEILAFTILLVKPTNRQIPLIIARPLTKQIRNDTGVLRHIRVINELDDLFMQRFRIVHLRISRRTLMPCVVQFTPIVAQLHM